MLYCYLVVLAAMVLGSSFCEEKVILSKQSIQNQFQDPKTCYNSSLPWGKVLHFIIALVITMAKQGVYVQQAYSESNLIRTFHYKFQSYKSYGHLTFLILLNLQSYATNTTWCFLCTSFVPGSKFTQDSASALVAHDMGWAVLVDTCSGLTYFDPESCFFHVS
jgi:hypothetical protein